MPFQTLAASAGRCFRFFEADGGRYLAFANIQGETTLYRWDGERFAEHQVLSGPGGRELCIVRTATKLYLVQINFMEGEPSAPRTTREAALLACRITVAPRRPAARP